MGAPPLFVATCDVHEKLLFTSRKRARLHCRRQHPGDSGMSAYECPVHPGLWHVGHLPSSVIRGKRSRSWARNFPVDNAPTD